MQVANFSANSSPEAMTSNSTAAAATGSVGAAAAAAACDNITGDVELYEAVYLVLYTYGLPIICVFGFLGNLMNLLILTGKRIQHSLRLMERSANFGLIALALADMSFCITAFPSTFLPQDNVFAEKNFLAYYGCYCAAVISIFIMTSTWLTVAMSAERYLAICHPLKSRNVITLRRTKVIIVIVYIASAVFNLPLFWRYVIVEQPNDFRVIPRTRTSGSLEHAYRVCWAVFGNLVPLIAILVFNGALLREIHRSYALRKRMSANTGRLTASNSTSDQEANHRITITLVCIVVMFFLLVAPSEVVKHIADLTGGDLLRNYTYLTIEIITNLMQTINFSANFILFCIVNPSFRKTMREMLSFRRTKLHLQHRQLQQHPNQTFKRVHSYRAGDGITATCALSSVQLESTV